MNANARLAVATLFAVCVVGLLAVVAIPPLAGDDSPSSVSADSTPSPDAGEAASPPSSDASSSTTSPSSSSQPEEQDRKQPEEQEEPTRAVTLAFAGDVAFEGAAAAQLAASPSTVFGAVAEQLTAADLAVVNLETAITERGTPAAKRFTFRAPASAFDALAAAGIDVASMANNHGLDFGDEGLADSLAASSQRGFPVIGIGADEDSAYTPFVTTIAGTRIAVVAATQVLDGNVIDAWTANGDHGGLASAKRVDRLVEAVQSAAKVSDFTVVFLHWGVEGDHCPSDTQRSLVEPLAAAGADAVVGGHAHRVQGFGMSGDTLVHYGFGNFLFTAQSEDARETGVLRMTVRGDSLLGAEWLPGRIDATNRPVPQDATPTGEQLRAQRRECAGLTAVSPPPA